MYLDSTAVAEICQDVVTLKTDVARIQQELQDLNERVARMFLYSRLLYSITRSQKNIVDFD